MWLHVRLTKRCIKNSALPLFHNVCVSACGRWLVWAASPGPSQPNWTLGLGDAAHLLHINIDLSNRSLNQLSPQGHEFHRRPRLSLPGYPAIMPFWKSYAHRPLWHGASRSFPLFFLFPPFLSARSCRVRPGHGMLVAYMCLIDQHNSNVINKCDQQKCIKELASYPIRTAQRSQRRRDNKCINKLLFSEPNSFWVAYLFYWPSNAVASTQVTFSQAFLKFKHSGAFFCTLK